VIGRAVDKFKFIYSKENNLIAADITVISPKGVLPF
jgi:hypothetical protein